MNAKQTPCRQSASDARRVNPVETHCVRLGNDVNLVETRFIVSVQTQTQSPVETRFIASSPHFPPHFLDKTTSVARRMSVSAQPYYLIYSMSGMNRVIRLDAVWTSVATEVKIRDGVTMAGIPGLASADYK